MGKFTKKGAAGAPTFIYGDIRCRILSPIFKSIA